LPEPLALAFGVFAIWAFMKFVEAKNYLFLYISSLSFALGALTKPFVLFYMIPAAYLAVKTFGFKGILNSRKLLFNLLAAFDLAVIPFFLWRIWMNQFPQGIPFFTWAFNGDGIRFRPAFWKWIFVERIGHLILGSWGIVLLFFGFFKGKQKELFSLVFFLAMFLYISVFATANVRHDYYQAAIIPAVSLILARGFIYVWELARKNTLSIFVFLFALAMMFLGGLSMVKEFYNINHPEIILAGQEVDKLAPKDALVVAPYNGDTAFLYQTGRWGWPYVDRPIEELVKFGADYFVSVNLNDFQTGEIMEKYQVIRKSETFVIVDLNQRNR